MAKAASSFVSQFLINAFICFALMIAPVWATDLLTVVELMVTVNAGESIMRNMIIAQAFIVSCSLNGCSPSSISSPSSPSTPSLPLSR